MSAETERVRCAHCFALCVVCRKNQGRALLLTVPAPRQVYQCCALCVCGEPELPPVARPWEDLGAGGAPIHPAKCGGPLGIGCVYCSALVRWQKEMRQRQRFSLETTGEAVAG